MIEFGNITINPQRCECRRGTSPVHLTKREMRIIEVLHAAGGDVVCDRDLIMQVSGIDDTKRTHDHFILSVRSRTCDTMVSTLRRKLGNYFPRTGGVGYRLTNVIQPLLHRRRSANGRNEKT